MCHYLGGGLHGRKKRVKAQSESSKSVVNSVLISREMPVFPGFLEIIRVVSGKKKQKAQKFKKSLNPQLALESKIQKAYDGYSTWQPLKPILAEWFGDDIPALASAANSWRNELAHEKREYQPDVDVVNAIRLVEHINYCIVLRQAGFNDE